MLRIVFAACVAAASAASALAQSFALSPGDTIDVSVLEDPALGRQVLVRPDGRISLPLAGTLQAAGRTPEALANDIRGRLAGDFVSPPTVTVSLIGLGAEEEQEADEVAAASLARIYVIGAVNAPGAYDVELPIDVLQALANAGGPDVFAARDRIQVRRAAEVLFFDYEQIEDGAVPPNLIEMADGDVLVVPERGLFE
jgi:Periplasmic protein involved in polysaccharide export